MLQISLDKIDWIANSIGKSPEELAKTVAPKKTSEFLEGKMGRTAIRKLAEMANQPLAFLFHELPLEDNNPDFPDLRQVQYPNKLSQEFYDVVKDIQAKISWYKDYLKQIDLYEPLPFISKYPYTSDLKVEVVVNDIRDIINIEDTFPRIKDSRILLNRFIDAFEALGILVFRNTMVGNSTRKPLSLEEFRGIAISDKYVPSIFINRRDSYRGSLFTLMHEVAHLWLGVEGVTNLDWQYINEQPIKDQDADIEIFCNKVAAELLMPTERFLDNWSDKADVTELINQLSDYFNTSELAVSIKAKELNLVTQELVNQIKDQTQINLKRKEMRKSNGGPPHLVMVPIRNSYRFTMAVVNQAKAENLSLREASRLINTKPANIQKIYRKQWESL